MRSSVAARTGCLGLTLAALAFGAPARAADPVTPDDSIVAPPPGMEGSGQPSERAPNVNQRPGEVPQKKDAEVPRAHRPPIPDGSTASPYNAASPRSKPVVSVGSGRTTASPVQTNPEVPAKPAAPDQIEELVRRSTTSIDFFELVDDILDEIARQLSLQDPNLMSPMAIRLVRLSPNLQPDFARTLEARLVARLVNATNVKVMVCAECAALRSRVENGNWVITLGAVRQEDLRRLGETTGIKTFMDVDFTYSADANVIWLEATVFRASDGGVVWSDAYRSDGTMAALLRTGKRIPTRAERAAELEQKIAARPSYGYAASLGVAQIGYNAPTGNVIGATVALRFHERFGDNQSNLFGLSAGIFTTGAPSDNKQPQALNSILLGAYYSHDLSEPNLNRPELWIYGEGGGMFTGNQGNTFYLESGLDLHLKFRLSLEGGLMYVLPTTYSNYDLGGLGFRLRVALNW
ncbi:MAG TPA: hypothetical protein VHH90_04740 [Polyangia bacterium]|nr:hypothetical protein [Polyangia bacterium]